MIKVKNFFHILIFYFDFFFLPDQVRYFPFFGGYVLFQIEIFCVFENWTENVEVK